MPSPDPGILVRNRNLLSSNVSELDGLLALGKRPGSTILPILRLAYNGGTLGFTNADQQRTIQIDAHTYRLALSVGVQPLRAAPLLDDADGGLPQRFLWMPCHDPGIRAWRLQDHPEPEWEVWVPPSFDGVTQLSVPQQVNDAVVEAALPPLETDTRNPLNSWAVLTQEKLCGDAWHSRQTHRGQCRGLATGRPLNEGVEPNKGRRASHLGHEGKRDWRESRLHERQAA